MNNTTGLIAALLLASLQFQSLATDEAAPAPAPEPDPFAAAEEVALDFAAEEAAVDFAEAGAIGEPIAEEEVFVEPPRRIFTAVVRKFDGLGIEADVSPVAMEVLRDRYSAELAQTGCFQLVDGSLIPEGQEEGRIEKTIQVAIGKIGETYTLNARVVDPRTRIIDVQVATDFKGPIEDLLSKAIPENAAALAQAVGDKF